MRISDWSSDVCSSDLTRRRPWSVDMILDPFALYWLPPIDDFAAALSAIRDGDPGDRFAGLARISNARLDFLQTRRLERALAESAGTIPDTVPRLRLALRGKIGRQSCRERVCKSV